MASEYTLITATRYDPFLLTCKWNHDHNQPCPFLLLRRHHRRLAVTIVEHHWDSLINKMVSYHDFKNACFEAVNRVLPQDDRSDSAFKIRISLNREGSLSFNVSPTHPCLKDATTACYWRPLEDNPHLFGLPIQIAFDTQPSETSLFTRTKTSQRQVYDAARERANISHMDWDDPSSADQPKDVILYRKDGLVTETSRCNICVYRPPYWYTPPLSTGCLPGVMRQWMLDQGRIREAPGNVPITRDGIRDGEYLLLLNSVKGCVPARVVVPPTP